jgi:uncharacterized protein (TIGR03435 family)
MRKRNHAEWRRLFLAMAAFVALTGLVVVGAVAAPLLRAQTPAAEAPKWEVVSVKPCAPSNGSGRGRNGGPGGGPPTSFSPDRMTLNCQTVMQLIRDAYVVYADGLHFFPLAYVPIEGAPAWINSERYSIEAKAEGTASRIMMQGPMLQALLEDRFKLKIHRETREVPVYALTVAKGGPKIRPHEDGSCIPLLDTDNRPLPGQPFPTPPPGKRYCKYGGGLFGPDAVNIVFDFEGVTIDDMCRNFLNGRNGELERPVIDKTGLAGKFDIHLEFAPSEATRQQFAEITGTPMGEPTAPSIFTAVQEQLGLRLEPTKGPGEFLVIDSVERPSPN